MAPEWATIPMLALLSSWVIPPRLSSPGFGLRMGFSGSGASHRGAPFPRKNPLSSATSATTVKTLDLAKKAIRHKMPFFGLFGMA